MSYEVAIEEIVGKRCLVMGKNNVVAISGGGADVLITSFIKV